MSVIDDIGIGVDNIDDMCNIANNLGTIYVDGMRRRLSRLGMNHNANNLPVKKATKEYGNDAEMAVSKEIRLGISK